MLCLAAGLVLCGCGAGSGDNSPPIELDAFCERLNEAGCDVSQRCKLDSLGTLSRTDCLVAIADAWDACPMAQQAVALGEASYDSAAARVLVDLTRDVDCGGPPAAPVWPDFVQDVRVFTPMTDDGATCHSKVSCIAGLTCEGSTASEPEGVCIAQ